MKLEGLPPSNDKVPMNDQFRQYTELLTPRKCGDCQACCIALGIPSINKAPGDRCRYQCSGGCNIYASKPKACNDYLCWWAMGVPLMERPDKSGIIIDTIISERVGEQVCARELVNDAWLRPKNRKAIERIANVAIVFIVNVGGLSIKKILGPEDQVRSFIADPLNRKAIGSAITNARLLERERA